MMMNDSYGMGAAFPRPVKPPPPNHLGNGLHVPVPPPQRHPMPFGFGGGHLPGVSPIANAIANQILHSHLNQPRIGVAHAAAMGLNDGLHNALVNSGLGSAFGQGGGPLQSPPASLSGTPVGYQPPTNPFGYTF